MTFDEWLTIGIESGFCREPVCETHDGAQMTADEQEAFESGGDPCVPIVRLLGDPDDGDTVTPPVA